MRITSWNVNSMRSRSDLVSEYLATTSPEVLVLQETKCPDARFPRTVFSDAGYEVAHLGDGPNGGVAIASRVGLERVQYGFAGDFNVCPDSGRSLPTEQAQPKLGHRRGASSESSKQPSGTGSISRLDRRRLSTDSKIAHPNSNGETRPASIPTTHHSSCLSPHKKLVHSPNLSGLCTSLWVEGPA